MAHSHHGQSCQTHEHVDHDLPHPREHEPEFEITLTAGQLNDLARFTATWSQIEFLITNIIALASKGDVGKTGMQLESMVMDARINHLRSLVPQMPNEKAKNHATTICDKLSEIIPRRNHAMHGVWGLFVDSKDMKPLPACFYGKSKDHPIFATELSNMTREAADASRSLGILLGLLMPAFTAGSPPRRFFFSDGPPPAGPLPDWHP